MLWLSRLKVSDMVSVKVGINTFPAQVLEVRPDKVLVRNVATGNEFYTTRVYELMEGGSDGTMSPPGAIDADMGQSPHEEPVEACTPVTIETCASQEEEDEEGEHHAARMEMPPKKLSLMEAALLVLKCEGRAMNTRELVSLSIERGLWSPRGGATPEQSLYSAFFHEIKNAKKPRVQKSTERGKFILV